MKRKHRIWPWIITPCILLFLTAVAFHVIPRRHLHTYKEQLRAQGYPLTLQECQTTPHTPQAIAAASQFNDAAQQLGSLSQTLENIPSPMPMSHPGHALPGWLAQGELLLNNLQQWAGARGLPTDFGDLSSELLSR
ncbi:MAG: hypothetical protein ACO34E_13675, partial [Limisphaerales bacterium]